MESPIISDLVMWGILILQIFIVLGVFELIFRQGAISRFVERRLPAQSGALALSFLLVVGAVLGSFYYSDILGFEPCRLCIYQRWLMIALTVVTGIAAYRRDRGAFPYIAGLSLVGFLVGLYHTLLPILQSSYVCAPGEVSCTTNYVTGFGYITIPVMSVTVFAAILLVWAFQKTRIRQLADVV
jgi:disulfide bond formation protein DsbB